MQDEVKVSQADVVRALDRAIEQIMGIEIEAMNGDNLAVTLCSHFDDPDGGELDDNGWSQAATDAYDEIKAEIAGKFVPVREAIAAFARHRQQAEREEEEAHKIGIDEGRQEMAREIDLATGGDGEFRYCMNGDPDRHCPDAEAMKVRVLDRFAALTIQRAFEERERKLREALKPFADCCDQIRDDEDDEEWAKFRLLVKDYRRARQALKETPDAH